MARTYTEGDLAGFEADPTDADGALAWVRFLSKDTGANEGEHSDAEWNALLAKNDITIDGNTYFRPHVTVREWILSQWNRGESESNRLGSITYRDTKAMADSVFTSNSWIDKAINAHLLANNSTKTLEGELTQGQFEVKLVI